MTKLYFISGASGSGKTAIKENLQELLGDSVDVFEFNDFDDVKIPDGGDKKWRQQTTEFLLKKILDSGKITCLIDQIVLGEILAF